MVFPPFVLPLDWGPSLRMCLTRKSTRKHPVRAQCFCWHASHSISRRPAAAAQSRVCKSLTSKVWYQIECILVSVAVAVVYCELSGLIQCKFIILQFWCKSQFSSVTQLWPTLCDPMNRSTPGLPVHHQFLEFTQAHVHWVSDAIQPSHPLLSPSPPAFNLSQHQGLFKWISSSHQVAKVLEFQLQHQSFQWTPSTGLL